MSKELTIKEQLDQQKIYSGRILPVEPKERIVLIEKRLADIEASLQEMQEIVSKPIKKADK